MKDGGKNENYRTCNNARRNENSARRLIRQKYKRISEFIWADYWCVSNSKEHWKVWMDTGWRIIPYFNFTEQIYRLF